MKYRIVHESTHRIRIRMFEPRITAQQEEILLYAFSAIRSVRKVTVFRDTAGVAFDYDGDREEILSRLDAFQYENVIRLAPPAHGHIQLEEVKARKLDPALKRKMRMRILAETVADAVLPLPVQLGYHAWQMITLRDI